MFIATYESRHYSFMAAGEDYYDCLSNMMSTLAVHGANNGLPSGGGEYWWDETGINILEINPGDGYRDYTKIL